MSNLDLKKTLKHLYKPSAKAISVVDVPAYNYLMIDGKGNPSSETFQEAVQTLYPLAYGIRALSKSAGITFTVMPLEGLWEFEGQEYNHNFVLTNADKDKFEWTLMIMQPEHITAEMVEQVKSNILKKDETSAVARVRFESYEEGQAVQILHIGSYDSEGDNVRKLHEYIHEQGYQLGKRHHEIYLNDSRKVAPEKLKTVIRQPFETE